MKLGLLFYSLIVTQDMFDGKYFDRACLIVNYYYVTVAKLVTVHKCIWPITTRLPTRMLGLQAKFFAIYCYKARPTSNFFLSPTTLKQNNFQAGFIAGFIAGHCPVT